MPRDGQSAADPIDLDAVEQLATDAPSCNPAADRARDVILRAADTQRAARLVEALRRLPPAGTLHP